jgi:hypothetical protein
LAYKSSKNETYFMMLSEFNINDNSYLYSMLCHLQFRQNVNYDYSCLNRTIVKFGFSPIERDLCDNTIDYCPLSDYSLIHTFEQLFIYVNKISKTGPITVICDSISYNACIQYHLETVENTNSTFLKVSKNVNYIQMSNFMNYPEAILSIHMDFGNSASFVFPTHLMTKKSFANNTHIHIKTSDFDVTTIIGATKEQHEKLLMDKDNIIDVFGEIVTTRDLLLKIVHARRDLYVYALIKINNTFYKVINTIETCKNTQFVYKTKIDMHTNLFLYKTLASAGHDIYKSSIDKQSEICSYRPETRNINNTSKVEILTCILLSKAHRSICNGRMYSVVDSDGTQFKPNFSLFFLFSL